MNRDLNVAAAVTAAATVTLRGAIFIHHFIDIPGSRGIFSMSGRVDGHRGCSDCHGIHYATSLASRYYCLLLLMLHEIRKNYYAPCTVAVAIASTPPLLIRLSGECGVCQ